MKIPKGYLSPDRIVLTILLVLILAVPFLLAPHEERVMVQTGRKLRILSPHNEGVRREFGWAFNDWHKKHYGEAVNCEWLDLGGTGNILRHIEARFNETPDGIGVDLMFGGGVEPYLWLKRQGWLGAYSPPEELLREIPPDISGVPMYDPDHAWFGAMLAGFGIIYNRPVLDRLGMPPLLEWGDMGLPPYRDWIASGDPRLSGSVHVVYEIILQSYGWEKGWEVLTCLAANARMFTKSAGDVPRNVAAGEVAAGMCIDSYAWNTVAAVGADRIGFVFPEDLTIINPDAVGILKGAPDRELSERAIRFILSEECQRLWILPIGHPGGAREFKVYRMSVRPDVYTTYADVSVVRVNPFVWENDFTFDAGKSSQRTELLNDLITAALIGPHPELVRAWRKVIEMGSSPEAVRALSAPMVSEEEALRLAREVWMAGEGEDARTRELRRSSIRADWAAFYLQRYRAMAGGAIQ